MDETFCRLARVIGADALERLKNAHVVLFGVGGVGGFAAEALARSGVGEITLIDGDDVAPSNLNRQIITDTGNIGVAKTAAATARVSAINPDCTVRTINAFYLPGDADSLDIDFGAFDYVADCIDTVSAKLDIITRAVAAGVPVISAMGAGNKLHPELFELADIYSTSVCPLARVMRRELKARGIKKLNVVYSREEAHPYAVKPEPEGERGRIPPGSVSFVPPVAGYIMAGKIIRDIAGIK